MQLAVVAAILPSLLLLSRTRAYPLLRIGAALFAALASAGWIVERVLNLPNPIGSLVEGAAHDAPSIAAGLFLLSLLCWLLHKPPSELGQPPEAQPASLKTLLRFQREADLSAVGGNQEIRPGHRG
jgi:hypothetical protein